MEYKENIKKLGTIFSGSNNRIVFTKVGDKKAYKVSASCGCSKPSIMQNGDIVVNYKPDKVPFHLINQGYYDTNKTITVTYNTGEQELLIIKARIVDEKR